MDALLTQLKYVIVDENREYSKVWIYFELNSDVWSVKSVDFIGVEPREIFVERVNEFVKEKINFLNEGGTYHGPAGK